MEGVEELDLGDMGNTDPNQILDLSAIRHFQRPKTAYIERLEPMRRVGRHIKGNDVVVLAVLLEVVGMVALVAIKDEEAICARCAPSGMLVKVLNPVQALLVGCPAVIADSDTPVAWKWVVFVPVGKVVFAGNDDVGRNSPALRIDGLNSCRPLPIALLRSPRSSLPFSTSHHYTSC